jgi:predicted site-specific integrase-resolvase
MRVLMPAEAGRRLGLTSSGVKWLVQTGRLKAFRTESGVHLFDEAEVERLRRRRDAGQRRGRPAT